MFIIPVGIDRTLAQKPVVCRTIMLICLAVQILQTLSSDPEAWVVSWGYVPGKGSLWNLLSHMFTHGGWLHLAGNMLFFFLTGFKLEDFMGWKRFLVFYLGCGVAANAVHLMAAGSLPIPCVGASGAIAGCLGGFFLLYPHARIHMLYWAFFIRGDFYIPAWLYLGFWFLKEVASMVAIQSEGAGIAFGAHAGGFAAGVIWAWAFWGWNRGDEAEAPETVFRAARP